MRDFFSVNLHGDRRALLLSAHNSAVNHPRENCGKGIGESSQMIWTDPLPRTNEICNIKIMQMEGQFLQTAQRFFPTLSTDFDPLHLLLHCTSLAISGRKLTNQFVLRVMIELIQSYSTVCIGANHMQHFELKDGP